jgi:chemotaxis protein methyltransferase CheR
VTWSTGAYADIAALVTERCGLSFPSARRAFAEAGIVRAMTRAHTKDTALYLELLHTDIDSFETLLSEITVGETYFYRDPRQFEFIKEAVLPSFDHSICIWSAGCSSGEEAYSLAIALEECGRDSGSQILATDISAAAIATARRGLYGDWSFREIDSMWRARYFTRAGKNKWAIAPRFAARVTFDVRNLANTRPNEDGFDVILCRNVLMYLESDVAARVTSHLIKTLRAGGWLFTSASDPIVSDADTEIVTTPAGLAYRRRASRSFGFERENAPLVGRSHFLSVENARSDSGHSRHPGSVPIQTPPREASSHSNPAPFPAAIIPIVDETLDPERYVREAMELLDADRAGEAAIAARRAIFLNRNGAFAHLLLGRALRIGGRALAARRALRRARRLCEDGDGIVATIDAELSLLRGAPASVEVRI